MAKTLGEYYAKDYLKCNLTHNFFGSWQGLAYPSHVVQAIAFPIQILTFYVIIKNSPGNMNIIKHCLLINHFWCTILDITICALSTPYIFINHLSFLGVGILSWFGIPFVYQLINFAFVAFFVGGSYVYLFESRSRCLQENIFRIKKNSHRLVYHSLLFLICSTLFWIFFNVPKDLESAKLSLLSLDPCPPHEFFLPEVFVMTTDPDLIHFFIWYHIPLIMIHAVLHTLFHAICTVFYVFISPSKITSPQTRQIQRQFFIGIIFQTAIPLVFLAVPIGYVVVAFFTGSLDQAKLNLAVITAGLHGIGESFAVIIVHNSYRKAIWKMILGWKKKGPQESQK
ncbi:hypothetical protein CAEBREN_11049 [Caenorhabditis brenneri]|uniref:Serpentine Receptor, class H n=1 Tax=Caenorhabditis brenneri TaxID=135651 RepID=G0NT21_CAEBE|nr:hypothetical protein CAEBREN_11049 [Caenorhabditis brenneri]